MVTLTRALIVSAAVLTSCTASGNPEPDLAPGAIVSVGPNTYKTRVIGEQIDVADGRALKLAKEYCARMKRAMAVKDKTFDMGYGYTLTWTCSPAQHAPIDH